MILNSDFYKIFKNIKKKVKRKKVKKRLKNYLSNSPEMNFSTFSYASSSVY